MAAKLPPLELLKANHSFPGPYTFKLIAESKADLVTNLILELKEVLEWAHDPKHSTRETAGGKHIAVTLELVMRKAEEVHIVYQILEKVDGVILIL